MNKGIFLFVVLSTVGFAAHATQDLSGYLGEKIHGVNAKVEAASKGAKKYPAIELADINIDVIATISFGIPGFADLAVSPEIDFVFVKDEE